MGNYHPHGDASIYDTLVRLAQEFSMRYPLVDGQGNFGSVDDDPAAAMRYTEARLTRMAMEMLRDLDMDTVDFVPNYDGRQQEPLVLPARFPNLLVNGSSGIAVGMATNIPPHNLREVVNAVVAYVDDPSLQVEDLMKHISGPDFPTGGAILGRQGIREAYETGRGRVRVRALAHIEPLSHGKEAIIVTELPYMVKKGGPGGLVEKIADLVREKKISEISDLRDESDRNGMRLVIELKRDALPKVVLNKLYKHTPMQSTFGVNMVALVDGVPRTLNLRDVIHHYVQHQREVIVRRTKYELAQKEARRHVLEGLLIAIDNLDAVIELIRGSRDRDAARAGLIEQFALSVIQAEAILALRLSQLTALETGDIKQHRGGIGVTGMDMKDGDYIEHLFICSTHDYLLFFTHRGKVYRSKVYELPEAQRTAKGRALVNILPLREGERVQSVLSTRDFSESQYVVFATRKGMVKKTKLADYNTPIKADGIIAINIRDDDELVDVRNVDDGDTIIMVSRSGQASRFEESKVRSMGRATAGVRGKNVSQQDNAVLVMDVARPEQALP